jgi:hypothetical protein
MTELLPGTKYVHYKHADRFYEIIGVGKNSETLEEMVIYKALYETKEFPLGQIWLRPKAMFLEKVIVNGKEVPRFSKVDEKLVD